MNYEPTYEHRRKANELVAYAFDMAMHYYQESTPEHLLNNAQARTDFITSYASMLCETLAIMHTAKDVKPDWE